LAEVVRIAFLGNDSLGGILSQSSVSKTSNILPLHTFLIPEHEVHFADHSSCEESRCDYVSRQPSPQTQLTIMVTKSRLFVSRIAAPALPAKAFHAERLDCLANQIINRITFDHYERRQRKVRFTSRLPTENQHSR
jgi:hypothetical protein